MRIEYHNLRHNKRTRCTIFIHDSDPEEIWRSKQLCQARLCENQGEVSVNDDQESIPDGGGRKQQYSDDNLIIRR